MLLQMFVINKILIANKIGYIKGGDELIEKFIKPKPRQLLKNQKIISVPKIFSTKIFFYLFKASFLLIFKFQKRFFKMIDIKFLI